MGIYRISSLRVALCRALLATAAAVGCVVDACADGAPAAGLNLVILGGEALASARGVVSLNQAAGTGNLQQNSVQVGRTLAAVGPNDAALALRPGGGGPVARPGADPSRNVAIMARGALEGASGVVQVSQVAGNANMTSNAISIRIAP